MKKTKNETIYVLLDETLKIIESDKPSITQAVQKLLRASELLGDLNTVNWCKSQLGQSNYLKFFKELSKKIKDKNEFSQKIYNEMITKYEIETHSNFNEEMIIRLSESSGGQDGIAFAEEKYKVLIREKRGNDNTYYQSNLFSYITFVKKETHERATVLYNKVSFSNMPETTFDILRFEVEDKLFEINPEFTEQLLNSFRRVSSNSNEDWAQALTTCRRLIIALADELYPPSSIEYKQRAVEEKNYINRIWAYMDLNIESTTYKELSQRHLDYFKNYLDKDVRLLNKGVHASVSKLDAIKAIHHTYLILADILQYLSQGQNDIISKSIYDVSFNDLISYGVNKDIAKKIIRYRVDNLDIEIEDLINIEGIGEKTLEKIKKGCEKK